MEKATMQSFIEEFVKKMGISIESIEHILLGSQHIFNIHTPDSKRLIGPQGDTLHALNHIVRRMSERVSDDKENRYMVDVNGYQLSKIRDLEQKAKLLADRVRTFRSSAEMTPMSGYERMIIHALFSEDPEITTKSEGMGKTRHIILSHKDSTH
jgi:spoIIIJ-associated protein